MSNNRETRINQDNVHLYIALKREGTSKDKRCLRQVIRDEKTDLKILEEKCKILGGEWRIHKTVNARNCEKARELLLIQLIKYPEKNSTIDIEWRTALLQRECRKTEFFMLDIDTQDEQKISEVEDILWEEFRKTVHLERYLSSRQDNNNYLIINKIKTPKGYHFITNAFDTREVCKLDYVTLLRDGYHYVKTVEKEEK